MRTPANDFMPVTNPMRICVDGWMFEYVFAISIDLDYKMRYMTIDNEMHMSQDIQCVEMYVGNKWVQSSSDDIDEPVTHVT